METSKRKPITERQRLWQFRFVCKPTPKHPRFMELECIDLFVWILDETVEQAAERAKIFVSAFPLDREQEFSADEITDHKINSGIYPAWQVDQFAKAQELGVQFGFLKREIDDGPE